jgi:hypothetical protein
MLEHLVDELLVAAPGPGPDGFGLGGLWGGRRDRGWRDDRREQGEREGGGAKPRYFRNPS